MRLPRSFLPQLPKNWLDSWLVMEVSGYKVAVAFDVFRILLAIQVEQDVAHAEIDYDRLTFTDLKSVVARAIQIALEEGFDHEDEDTTIEQLLAEDEASVIAMGV